jgi:hypothetical protein
MWSEEEGGNDRYDLVEELAEQTAGVLLTATPEQLGVKVILRVYVYLIRNVLVARSFLDEETISTNCKNC